MAVLPPGTIHLFPGFLAVFVGVACLFCPFEDVSFDEGRVMLFFVATRVIGICLVLLGSFALWQAPTILLPRVV